MKQRRIFALFSLLALGGLVAIGARSLRPSFSAATSAAPKIEASDASAPGHTEAPRAVPRALAKAPASSPASPPAASEDALAAFRQGLASADLATRISSVESAVSATNTRALSDLEKFDLAADPRTAPTVIHAIALLGASAEGQERETAASTLESWLKTEMQRDAPDARGNVSNIVESLGDLGGHEAVTALDSMLDGADAPLHLETLAVQKLGDIGGPDARASVERFAQRAAALPPSAGIDEELRVEAIQAASSTLAKL